MEVPRCAKCSMHYIDWPHVVRPKYMLINGKSIIVVKSDNIICKNCGHFINIAIRKITQFFPTAV